MLIQTVCQFNKFGFCKFGNRCFRHHENKLCKNGSCQVLECQLRHPKKCKFFSQYFYCKFGTYCRFSHEKNDEGKSLEIVEKQLEDVKNEIRKKTLEMKSLSDEIPSMEKNIKSEMLEILRKMRRWRQN